MGSFDFAAGPADVSNLRRGSEWGPFVVKIETRTSDTDPWVATNLAGATVVAQVRVGPTKRSRLVIALTIDSSQYSAGVIIFGLPQNLSAALADDALGNWYWELTIDGVAALPAELSTFRGTWQIIDGLAA